MAEDVPRPTGHFVTTIEGARAFVPDPLRARLALPAEVVRALGDARQKLGVLNEGVKSLPRPDLLIRPFQKREAVLSSRIEGTRTTLEEAFLGEAVDLEPESDEDALEVRNYEKALRLGLQVLASGQTLTLQLIRALHRELLSGVRGEAHTPGEYRARQVFLGRKDGTIHEARFVPPPPLLVKDCLEHLDAWLASRARDDPLVRVAMAHYQFEAIHPFLDGNGRVGRLLVVLQMVHEGLVEQPWVYVSPFLERQRDRYCDCLLRVSTHGEWIPWIEFFIQAVIESVDETTDRVHRLRALRQEYEQRLAGLQTQRPLQLLSYLFALPYITVPMARLALDVSSSKTAQTAIDRLVEAEILQQLGRRLRVGPGRPARIYRCKGVAEIVRE